MLKLVEYNVLAFIAVRVNLTQGNILRIFELGVIIDNLWVWPKRKIESARGLVGRGIQIPLNPKTILFIRVREEINKLILIH